MKWVEPIDHILTMAKDDSLNVDENTEISELIDHIRRWLKITA
jgi:hypothetical protein